MVKKQRVAKFKMTKELVAQALSLPEGTKLLNLILSKDGKYFEIFVRHEDLREVDLTTNVIPEIEPFYSTQLDLSQPNRLISLNWNQTEE